MLVILFRSRLVEEPAGYEAVAEEMLELGRTMPGFIDFKSFKAEDGERLSVAWWQDEETLTVWRENVRHRMAQRLGREKWYESFTVEVAEIVRSTQFVRPVTE